MKAPPPHILTRRALLASGVGAMLSSACEPDPITLDEAFARMHGKDVEFEGGLANHGSMACEALLTLGHEDELASFLDDYEGRLEPLPQGTPMSDAQQAAALGDVAERGNWIATFDALLKEGDPFAHFSSVWDVLAPGYAAAGFHGALRVAHALRALAQVDNAVRRTELAHGLGLWAARYQELPGDPGAQVEAGLDVGGALGAIPHLPAASDGLIGPRLAGVSESPAFAETIERVDLDALPVSDAITTLASAAARMYCAAADSRVLELHAVTGSSAFRLLMPYLSAQQQRVGLGYVFRAVGAAYATSAVSAIPGPPSSSELDADELRDEAGDASDEHEIKLAEACLREHAIAPRVEFLVAGGISFD